MGTRQETRMNVMNKLSTTLLVGTLMVAGCATVGTLQTADTVGQGNFEFGVEPSYWGIAGGGGGGGFVQLGLSGRFGVGDRADIGFRIATNGGAEVLTKFAFTDPTSPGIKVALAPSGGGFMFATGGAAAGVLHFQVPLIFGIPVGASQFVFAPKVHEWVIFAGGGGDVGGGSITSAGASIGFAARVSKNLRILPEVAVVTPLFASAGFTGVGTEGDIIAGDAVLMQFGLGFIIGGQRE
jgi:hypothetical protein